MALVRTGTVMSSARTTRRELVIKNMYRNASRINDAGGGDLRRAGRKYLTMDDIDSTPVCFDSGKRCIS